MCVENKNYTENDLILTTYNLKFEMEIYSNAIVRTYLQHKGQQCKLQQR